MKIPEKTDYKKKVNENLRIEKIQYLIFFFNLLAGTNNTMRENRQKCQ